MLLMVRTAFRTDVAAMSNSLLLSDTNISLVRVSRPTLIPFTSRKWIVQADGYIEDTLERIAYFVRTAGAGTEIVI